MRRRKEKGRPRQRTEAGPVAAGVGVALQGQPGRRRPRESVAWERMGSVACSGKIFGLEFALH